MTTPAEVRDAIEAGYAEGHQRGQEVVRSLYAAKVRFRHEPPHPGDGVISRDELAAAQRAEGARFASAITDFRQDEVTVTLDGEHIVVAAVLAGMLPDGAALQVPITMRYIVDGGAIIEMVATVENSAQLGAS